MIKGDGSLRVLLQRCMVLAVVAGFCSHGVLSGWAGRGAPGYLAVVLGIVALVIGQWLLIATARSHSAEDPSAKGTWLGPYSMFVGTIAGWVWWVV
jgi:uncharacterized membrane protein YeaQ/YmgE (transglycosylase-associated protein family)